MSHARRIIFAVFVIVSVAIPGLRGTGASTAGKDIPKSVPPAAIDTPANLVLVKRDWCEELCEEKCVNKGGCRTYTSVGCTCYWVCANDDDGMDSCGGAIGIKICDG